VLHQVIAEHLEPFLRAVAEAGDGAGLPQFVEREFREFLLCGVFEAGVARFLCEGCGLDHLLPFSCKGRAWCPSCGGRRMTERAAHLVDAVLPWVPVRQWVLTMPYRLRYQMAWNHGLSRAVLRVYTRVLLDVYARGVPGGRTGSVTVMQRAGSGLNVNLHFHTLVLDGVFTEEPRGALAFQPLGPVHLKAVRETGGVRFSWRPRKRGLAGITFAARLDLGEEREAYELEILSGSTVLRTLSPTAPSTLYATSDETLDFGGAQSSFSVRLYQISAAVGRGLAATATLIP